MNFARPHFEEPQWLLLAVIGPLLMVFLFRYAAVKRKQQLTQIASPRFVEELTSSHSSIRRGFKNIFLMFAMAFIGIALARPQWGELQATGRFLGEDVVFALDCSASMLAADVQPSRLQRSKLAILNFVRTQGRGRVGLVAFAGSAFLQCPLTLDYDAFSDTLEAVDDKTIPLPGTDIGRALKEANHAMEKGSRRKLVVLLTDGEDLERGGVKTAQTLATNGVVVFTIGVGSPAGTEIRVVNATGQSELLRDNNGEVVRSRLDEETLRGIAQATGGNYYPLGAAGEGLAKVRAAVEILSGSDDRSQTRSRGVDRFHLAIAAALGLMVVESLVGTRKSDFQKDV
jgi:Ca-activated chloride channel family protein